MMELVVGAKDVDDEAALGFGLREEEAGAERAVACFEALFWMLATIRLPRETICS